MTHFYDDSIVNFELVNAGQGVTTVKIIYSNKKRADTSTIH